MEYNFEIYDFLALKFMKNRVQTNPNLTQTRFLSTDIETDTHCRCTDIGLVVKLYSLVCRYLAGYKLFLLVPIALAYTSMVRRNLVGQGVLGFSSTVWLGSWSQNKRRGIFSCRLRISGMKMYKSIYLRSYRGHFKDEFRNV